MMGRPKAFATAKKLQQGIDGYIDYCKSHPITVRSKGTEVEIPEPITVSGLCHHLGITRETLSQYAKGTYDTSRQNYSDAIKTAKLAIERDKVTRAMLGLYDRTICIFDLKNNHDWKDVQHVDERSDRTERPDPKTLDELKADVLAELRAAHEE